MIGVVTHQRRKIERRGQTGLSVLEQELESRVGVARAAEAGELTHGPQFAAIPGGVNAARVRIRPRHTQSLRALRIDVDTLSSGMPSNSTSMSARLDTATPVFPTSPSDRG